MNAEKVSLVHRETLISQIQMCAKLRTDRQGKVTYAKQKKLPIMSI